MLVISRRKGESLIINGNTIVTVTRDSWRNAEITFTVQDYTKQQFTDNYITEIKSKTKKEEVPL